MNPSEEFQENKRQYIKNMSEDVEFQKLSGDWYTQSVKHNYSYLFSWMGRPIIQQPCDMVLYQEIIFSVKPDLIIETGIAHGGSIIYSAALLELLSSYESGSECIDRKVVGIDIDIRSHNRIEIENHPMNKRIIMLEGSSDSDEIVERVNEIAKDKKKILVCLDSAHSYRHVLNELRAYAPLVSKDSYFIVWDTVVEYLPDELNINNRPWGVGNSPMTAVDEFLKENDDFVIDVDLCNKAVISCAPRGFLKRIK